MRFGIPTIDGILPKSVRLRRPHWITAAIYIRLLRTTAPTVLAITSSRRWVLVSALVRAAAGRRNPPGGELLHLNLRALLLELLPHVFRLGLRELLLDRLRRAVHEVLRLLEAQARQLANDLDHLDLLFARRHQHHIELRLLFSGGTARRRARCAR